jgi:hypothetical protein
MRRFSRRSVIYSSGRDLYKPLDRPVGLIHVPPGRDGRRGLDQCDAIADHARFQGSGRKNNWPIQRALCKKPIMPAKSKLGMEERSGSQPGVHWEAPIFDDSNWKR